MSFYLVMALEQGSKFALNLEMDESYIYAPARRKDISYNIVHVDLTTWIDRNSCRIKIMHNQILLISMAHHETFNKEYPPDSLWCISETRK